MGGKGGRSNPVMGLEIFGKKMADFSEFKGLTQVGAPHLYKISQSLEEIEKDLHRIATGFNRIKVNTYDNENRERERAEQEERHRHRERSEVDIRAGSKEGSGGGENAGRRVDG